MQSAPIDLSKLDQKSLLQLKRLIDDKTDKLVITSAYLLGEKERAMIVEKLGLTDRTDVLVENIVDKHIFGGLIIKFGSFYIDYSLKGQLAQINESLQLT